MDLLMNGLLMAATLFAGGYCWVLGRRVHDLKSLDRGLGGSIVTLTRQIELARATLEDARGASKETRADLDRLIGKADAAANQLKLLIAAAPIYPPAARPAEPPVTAPAPVAAVAPEWPASAAGSSAKAAVRSLTLPEVPAATVFARVEPHVESSAGRQVEPALADADEPEAAAPAVPAMNLAEVPKPRALAPIENPLRRAKGAAKGSASGTSEDAILEALTALAGGGR